MKINKVAVAVLAIIATLVFAVPSFAETVYIDFAGSIGTGSSAPSVKPTLYVNGATVKGDYLPIDLVTADGVKDYIKAYLSFEISPTVTKLTIQDSLSPNNVWLTSNSFTYSGGSDVDDATRDTLFTIKSGSATLGDYGFKYLDGKGLTLDQNLAFKKSTLHIVEESGKVKSVSLDVMGKTTTVPEPMAAALLVPGIGLLGLIRRRFLV